jgi:protein-S-isoprenylcysteine O-methyltransferase Ste14
MRLALRSFFATLLLPGLVAVAVPWLIAGGWRRGELAVLGTTVSAIGVALYLACAWAFAVEGCGTPAPWDPPRFVVRGGLYRLSRNPMYVGVLLLVFGQALLFDSLAVGVYAGVLAAGFHLRVLWFEEPHLRKVFGPDYEDYCRRVPRWLPGLRHWV